MPRVKRSVHARKKRRKVLDAAPRATSARAPSPTARRRSRPEGGQPRLPRPQAQEAHVPQPLDRPDQRGRAPGGPLVQPVRRRLPEGEHRARPQGARRHRGQRPARVHEDRRAGQGRARGASRLVVITSAANPRVKLVRKLESRRQREKLGLFACEGEDLVAAGLDAGSSRWRRSSTPSARRSSSVCPAAEIGRARADGRALDARAPAAGRRRLPPGRPPAWGRICPRPSRRWSTPSARRWSIAFPRRSSWRRT